MLTSQGHLLWGSVGLFLAMHMFFFRSVIHVCVCVCVYIYIYIHIYIYMYTHAPLLYFFFQTNGSLLNPTDYCSNFKVCLNKICTLPAASDLFISWVSFCHPEADTVSPTCISLSQGAFCRLSDGVSFVQGFPHIHDCSSLTLWKVTAESSQQE